MLGTCFDESPEVGVLSLGSASGIASSLGRSCIPGQPIHKPLHSTTTGATAVTSPPALKHRKHKMKILPKMVTD